MTPFSPLSRAGKRFHLCPQLSDRGLRLNIFFSKGHCRIFKSFFTADFGQMAADDLCFIRPATRGANTNQSCGRLVFCHKQRPAIVLLEGAIISFFYASSSIPPRVAQKTFPRSGRAGKGLSCLRPSAPPREVCGKKILHSSFSLLKND